MTRRVFSPLLMLTTLAASPATQPSSDFLVTGTVTDDAGEPVHNATVVARCGRDDNRVPTGYEWSFQNRDRGYDQSNLSAPFTLTTPDTARFTVTADSEKHTLTSTPADDANANK